MINFSELKAVWRADKMKNGFMLKPYKEYKDTNYDWLPNIPSHWKWVFLSQASKEQCVKNTNNAEKNVLSLSYGNIIKKNDINFGLVPKEYTNYQIVDAGNIILRLTDLQNDHTSLRTGLVREKGIITSAYTCLKPFENPKYLQYLLHSYDTRKIFYGIGGGVRQSIGYKEIRNVSVPLPPHSEQDQIVRFLDWKVSIIDKYINAKKKQVALLQEQKQAIINQAVTKSNGGWNNMRFRFLCKIMTGNKDTINKNDTGKYPFYVRSPKIERIDTYSYDGEAVLMAGDGVGAGRVFHYVNGRFDYHQRVYCFYEFIDKINVRYLYYYMTELFPREVDKGTAKSTVDSIRLNMIQNFTIFFPVLSEQEKIVRFLDKQISLIVKCINKINTDIELLSEYRTRLIFDVITGKIDVRNVKVLDIGMEEIKNFENEENMSEYKMEDNY
jgi:type I restriction enzyme S subunit